MHDEHLLDAHAVAEALAVLGLQRKGHASLDLDGMVEGPDARDHRRIVLREAKAMAPQIGRGLILLLVAPGLLCGWPLLGDLARRGARLHRADGVIEPFQRGGVGVLLLLVGSLPTQ